MGMMNKQGVYIVTERTIASIHHRDDVRVVARPYASNAPQPANGGRSPMTPVNIKNKSPFFFENKKCRNIILKPATYQVLIVHFLVSALLFALASRTHIV